MKKVLVLLLSFVMVLSVNLVLKRVFPISIIKHQRLLKLHIKKLLIMLLIKAQKL